MRTPPGFQPGAPVLTRLQFQASAWQGTTLPALSAQEKKESGGPRARLYQQAPKHCRETTSQSPGRQEKEGAGGACCSALAHQCD